MAIEDALRDPIRTKIPTDRVELYIERLLLVSLVGDDVAAAETGALVTWSSWSTLCGSSLIAALSRTKISSLTHGPDE